MKYEVVGTFTGGTISYRLPDKVEKHTMRFKVGDRVRMTRAIRIIEEDFVGHILTINACATISHEYWWVNENDLVWHVNQLELVTEGKKMKAKKVEKHAVILDDCFNLVSFYDSLSMARDGAKCNGKEEPVTVYKLIPVYHYEPSVKESKVK